MMSDDAKCPPVNILSAAPNGRNDNNDSSFGTISPGGQEKTLNDDALDVCADPMFVNALAIWRILSQ